MCLCGKQSAIRRYRCVDNTGERLLFSGGRAGHGKREERRWPHQSMRTIQGSNGPVSCYCKHSWHYLKKSTTFTPSRYKILQNVQRSIEPPFMLTLKINMPC